MAILKFHFENHLNKRSFSLDGNYRKGELICKPFWIPWEISIELKGADPLL